MRSFLRRRPLRVKISLLMVVLLSAGLLVSSFIATTALSGYLMDRVDEALSAGSRPLMSMAVPLDEQGGDHGHALARQRRRMRPGRGRWFVLLLVHSKAPPKAVQNLEYCVTHSDWHTHF